MSPWAIGQVCSAKAKSGLPNFVKRPSFNIALAPASVSSAGWAMNISVPCQRSFSPTSVFAVPTQAAMCRSCPQLWATKLSLPR